jgi:hypothetical protein
MVCVNPPLRLRHASRHVTRSRSVRVAAPLSVVMARLRNVEA